MKKRVLFFLTAAVMLLASASGLACVHYDKSIVEAKDLKLRGHVEPEIGVPGYSGDLCCPVCGEVVIPGGPLAPKENSPGVAVTPGKPSQKKAPDQPVTQAKPESPVRPEEPVRLPPQEKPEEPVRTAKPEKTARPTDRTRDGQKPKVTASPERTVKSGQPSPAENTAGPGTEKPARERFSVRYPYRRVKMQPVAGIRAEAAGILLWSAAASPFQSLFR